MNIPFRESAYIVIAFIVVAGCPSCVYAQMDLEQERSSLHGLEGVDFVVNLEQNTAYADSSLIKIIAIKKTGEKILTKNHIQLISNERARRSTRIPVLYMHINMLSTRTGIISFSVTINLLQPVKLMLRNGQRTIATTWQDGIVGIASYDKISVIKQAAMSLVRSFVSAYINANSR